MPMLTEVIVQFDSISLHNASFLQRVARCIVASEAWQPTSCRWLSCVSTHTSATPTRRSSSWRQHRARPTAPSASDGACPVFHRCARSCSGSFYRGCTRIPWLSSRSKCETFMSQIISILLARKLNILHGINCWNLAYNLLSISGATLSLTTCLLWYT